MPTYTAEQLANVRIVRRTLRRNGATRKEVRSAITTILVESNAQHDRYSQVGSGDRDSVGAFQQRPSQGWGPAGESIRRDAKQYLKAAKAHRGEGLTAAQLAQAVQRSAFPGRYKDRMPEAKALLRQVGGGKQGRPGRVVPGQAPRLIPGGTSVDRKGALVAALTKGGSGSLLQRWQGEIATGAHTTTTKPRVVKGKPDEYRPGKESKAAPAAGGTIHELFWNGPGATNIKNGKRVPKGFVDGHTGHVHLAADRATMERAAKLARSMGLHVGEYGRGITSGHAPNSNHYKPFGAMDVSGKRMAEFARRIARGDY